MTRVHRSSDIWRLKLKRAQYHMAEIEREVRRYVDSHPYEVVKRRQSKQKPNHRIYKIRITRQPDPMVGVILGEFVHNLRSALDNAIVACAPNKYRFQVSFPISTEEVVVPVGGGAWRYRDDAVGERFKSCLVGVPPPAQAIVEKAQPYRTSTRESHSLRLLSRLDNADKHRTGLIIGYGIRNAMIRMFIRGEEVKSGLVAPSLREIIDNDATIAETNRPGLSDADVDVQVRGTACITIKIAMPGSSRPEDFRLQSALWRSITDVRWVVNRLEPYVIRR